MPPAAADAKRKHLLIHWKIILFAMSISLPIISLFLIKKETKKKKYLRKNDKKMKKKQQK